MSPGLRRWLRPIAGLAITVVFVLLLKRQLQGADGPHAGPDRRGQAEHDHPRAAGQRLLGISQLGAEHWDLAERPVDEVVAQLGAVLEDDAEDRHQGQQEREHAEERVIRDRRREVAPPVLAEALGHGQREADDPMAALPGIEAFGQRHHQLVATTDARIAPYYHDSSSPNPASFGHDPDGAHHTP